MTIYEGDRKRREALIACEQSGAYMLKQILESPRCRVSGSFGYVAFTQYEMIEEILKLVKYTP